MNYKWLFLVGAFFLLCILFLINDNSDDFDESDNPIDEFVETKEEDPIAEIPPYKEIEAPSTDEKLTDETYTPVVILNNIEIPRGGLDHNVYASHEGYSLSYDTINHCPFWVAWELTSSESQGRSGKTNDYRPDPQLPYKHQVSETAFSGSGYDRGHMCPAGDQKWSELAMSESFFMSNMCPQDPTLNQVWWEHLEKAERRWAKQEGTIYIVCGPIFDNKRASKWIDGYIKIGIPDGFFKVFLSLKQRNEKAIGFIFRNNDSRQPVGKAACSVDVVEEMTGFDFFSALDDQLEKELESKFNMGKWN